MGVSVMTWTRVTVSVCRDECVSNDMDTCDSGPCTWCCVSGRRVVLKPISILHLSEAERLALQKLASSKLQTMDLGCPIIVPKDTKLNTSLSMT
ncbi:hypothetical protein ACOMHN_036986 [Nucella lapillus]